MRKFHFEFNRLAVKKREDQKVNLPIKQDLNEQELASVTGGVDGYWKGHYYQRDDGHHGCR